MKQELIPILQRILDCELPDDIDSDVELERYGMDSINCIALIVELESCFDIVIDDENLILQSVNTIGAIQRLIDGSEG